MGGGWTARALRVRHAHQPHARPERRRLTQIRTAFRKRHVFSEPYEAVTSDDPDTWYFDNVRVRGLPLDPVAATAAATPETSAN